MSGTESKVVVIPGASSGTGEATALLLASGGAKLALGALTNACFRSGQRAAYAAKGVKTARGSFRRL
jgi:NADP-dependent 3-hydroxy acid dehydrogenase YdfG